MGEEEAARSIRGGGRREAETKRRPGFPAATCSSVQMQGFLAESGVSARARRNGRRLGDGSCSWDVRVLLVVFQGERAGDVLRVGAEACHQRHRDAVLQAGHADADRLEEPRESREGHVVIGPRSHI